MESSVDTLMSVPGAANSPSMESSQAGMKALGLAMSPLGTGPDDSSCFDGSPDRMTTSEAGQSLETAEAAEASPLVSASGSVQVAHKRGEDDLDQTDSAIDGVVPGPEASPAGPSSHGSSLVMVEPRLHAVQNVRMSRGCYREPQPVDGPLWDFDDEASSSDDQVSSHSDREAHSISKSADMPDQAHPEQRDAADDEPSGGDQSPSPQPPHSTSSSDEWMRKQAGSSSTSSWRSSRRSSSQGSPETYASSPNVSRAGSVGDSPQRSLPQIPEMEQIPDVSAKLPPSSPQASAEGAQAGSLTSSEREMSVDSSREVSNGSIGVASLSAGIASQAASTGSASDAVTSGTGNDQQEASSRKPEAPQAALGSSVDEEQQSLQTAECGIAMGNMPRSQSMDVEVGSLGGNWAEDAQTLGLAASARQAQDASDSPPALQAASSAADTSPSRSAADPPAASFGPEIEQLAPGYKTGASSSFLQGELPSSGAGDSTEPQATPPFNLLGHRAGLPLEQVTPQLMMFGRPRKPLTEAPPPAVSQPLITAPSLESDAATPLPKIAKEPIHIAEAVTSSVQVPMSVLQGTGSSQQQAPRPAAHVTRAQDPAGSAPAGDLMSPPMIYTPVMPRRQQHGKAKAASKRTAASAAEPVAASEMSHQPAAGVGRVDAGHAPRPASVFLTTPPPPTAPKVSSRTRRRSPKYTSSTASGTAPVGTEGQTQNAQGEG